MFNREQLENDHHFISIISYTLYSPIYKIGRLIDIHTVNQFIDKLLQANLEEIKYLPKSKLHIYRTSDLGFGYSLYISPARLHELIELNKVSKDIPIQLEYKYGNIFTYINLEDIDSKLLLTDDIYIIVNKETKEIWNIIISKPTNPNLLYYKENLNGKIITLEKLKLLQHFNRINVHQEVLQTYI